jgi:hypothetical protein
MRPKLMDDCGMLQKSQVVKINKHYRELAHCSYVQVGQIEEGQKAIDKKVDAWWQQGGIVWETG